MEGHKRYLLTMLNSFYSAINIQINTKSSQEQVASACSDMCSPFKISTSTKKVLLFRSQSISAASLTELVGLRSERFAIKARSDSQSATSCGSQRIRLRLNIVVVLIPGSRLYLYQFVLMQLVFDTKTIRQRDFAGKQQMGCKRHYYPGLLSTRRKHNEKLPFHHFRKV